MSSNVMSSNELYTLEEVATYFRVHPMTVRDWIKRRILRGFKAGRDWRFTKQNIDECAEALQVITEEKKGAVEQALELISSLSKEQRIELEAKLQGRGLLTAQLTLTVRDEQTQ